MSLVDEFVVTHVTAIKKGRWGQYITVTGYKTDDPDPANDDVYQFNLSWNERGITKKFIREVGLKADVFKRLSGELTGIPNGIIVSVSFESNVQDIDYPGRRFLKYASNMNFIDVVKKKIVARFRCDEISYHDWGISVNKKGDVDYNLIIYGDHLPFKVSSILDRYKKRYLDDAVVLRLNARVFYVNVKINNSWHIKKIYKFDSRIDDISNMQVDDCISGMKLLYIELLKLCKTSPKYGTVIKELISSWKNGFASIGTTIESGTASGIVVDPRVIISLFFKDTGIDESHYYRILAFIPGEPEIYLHSRDDGTRKVAFIDNVKSMMLVDNAMEGTVHFYSFNKRSSAFLVLDNLSMKNLDVTAVSSLDPGDIRFIGESGCPIIGEKWNFQDISGTSMPYP
jgi:hypothetical protein